MCCWWPFTAGERQSGGALWEKILSSVNLKSIRINDEKVFMKMGMEGWKWKSPERKNEENYWY